MNLRHPQRLLACLGDPSRFRVVKALMVREHCVTDLAQSIGLSQSCTTRHLQALSRVGVVRGVRDGKRVLFRLCTDDPKIDALIRWATEAGPAIGSTAVRAARTGRGTSSPPAGEPAHEPGGEPPPDAPADDATQAEPAPAVRPVRHPASQEIEDYLL